MDDSGNPKTKSGFISAWKKLFGGKSAEDYSEEEIISLVNEGQEMGVLEAMEAEMIQNIFEYGDKEAKDIMVHRSNVIALDGTMSYFDAVGVIVKNGRSRYPVYLEDIDHIIGILHIKDAFAFCQSNEVFRSSIKDIPGLIREVEFVPETMGLDLLFRQMQQEKSHMVVVVDEYGQNSGIVAMEDILEEIVGNIQDEHDEEEEVIQKESDGSLVLDGLTRFEDVVEELHLPLEEDAFETFNGFLISLLGKVPSEGEHPRLNAYGYCFDICEVEGNRIGNVTITVLDTKVDSLAKADKE